MKSSRITVLAVAVTCIATGACGAEGNESAPEEDTGSSELAGSVSWCGGHWKAAPTDFWPTLANAAEYMPNVPDFWGQKGTDQGNCMAKIACRESDWLVHATNGDYRGMYQIDKGKFPMLESTYAKYWSGGKDQHGDPHVIRFWQHYAAFRYILSRYAGPCAGWQHEIDFGWW